MNSRTHLATEEKALPQRKGTLSWVVLAITLLGLVASLGLGTWQLRRAAYKVALASQIESKSKLAAIENIAQTTGPIDQTKPESDNPWVNRRVDLRGLWLTEHTVFLDNRFMANRAGFYVVTPLQQEGSNAVVWVQRGWVPRNVQDRTRLPDVPTPAGTVQVQGRLAAAVSRAYELGAAQNQPADALRNASPQGHAPSADTSAPASARASRIWQNLPIVNFGPQAQLMPAAILQTATPNAPQDGLLRDWPQADMGVAKHYGYAFQWFALCGLIIALYVWFQILAPRRKPS